MSGTHGLFIVGTDTGVGKTRVAGALLAAYARLGLRCVGMKPVAAGAELHAGTWRNDDVEHLRACSNIAAADELINPYLLREAMAPHIAAERKGVNIELPRIRAAYETLAAQADVVVVEGVGGLRVPLSARTDTADLAVALGLPLILVVGMRLGCLNHALLTHEAIAARGLRLAGWVANRIDPDMIAYDENVAALAQRIPAPMLAELPWASSAEPQHLGDLFPPKRLSGLIESV